MTAKPGAADRLREPAHNGLLDRHRRGPGAPRRDILVQDTGKEISDGGHGLSRTEDVAEKASVLRARKLHHIVKLVQTLVGEPPLRQGPLKPTLGLTSADCG